MNALKLLTVLFLLFSTLGCQKRTQEDGTIHSINALIQKAENEKYSLSARLIYAAGADSLAQSTSNKAIQLESKRTAAGINLMLGNLSVAQAGFSEMAALAVALSDSQNLAIAYNNLAIIFDKKDEYDSALMYYDKAILNFGNEKNQLQTARAIVNIGIVQFNQENYEDAFNSSAQAAKVLEQFGAKDELASVYITLGLIQANKKSFENAMRYFDRAMILSKEVKDSAGIAIVLTNMGDVYRGRNLFQQALRVYKQSWQLKELLGLHQYSGEVLNNIGEVLALQNMFDTAEMYFKRALEIETINDDKLGILTTSNSLSKLHLKQGNVFKAKAQATQVQKMFPEKGFLKQKLENDLVLFEVFRKLQHDSALKYASLIFTLKDAVSDSIMTKNVARLDAKYRIKETQSELLLSQKNQKVQSMKIEAQRKLITLIVSFLVLLSLLLTALFHLFRNISKANIKIEALMKELNHRVENNLQIVSDMFHLQSVFVKDQNQLVLLQSCINRVDSMNIIHSLLYQKGFTGEVNMNDFIKALIFNIANAYQEKSVFQISVGAQDINLNVNQAILVGLITNELTTNIFKYSQTFEVKYLQINLTEKNKNCILEIKDNCGHWNIQAARKKKNGLGLFLVETFVKQLKATWKPVSNEFGTNHCIEFSS